MGRAEDLFSRIEREGVAAIDALIADRASEELFLDFKRSATHGEGGRLDNSDRSTLRKAIGGFANSEGGVIVWGVECSKQSDRGDVASAKVPIANPQRFTSWLEGATSGCTVPPVVGVRSIAVPIDGSSGFVATYVPQSVHAPHQLAGEGRYMIRAGSEFSPAPHGVVAGLFGRAPRPVIYPNFKIQPATSDQGRVLAGFTIVVVNDGQVVAEDVFVSVMLKSAKTAAGQTVFVQSEVRWQMTNALGLDWSWVAPREFRLAPRGMVEVATVGLRLPAQAMSDFECHITTGCNGAIPETCHFNITKAELDHILQGLFVPNGQIRPGIDLSRLSQELLGMPEGQAPAYFV